MLLIAGALTAAALAGFPEPPGRHHDFEALPVGGAPEGWFVPAAVAAAGTTARVTDNNPAHGARCVEIVKTGTNLFGNLMQSFDAAPYRGLRVRLSASVRVHGTGPSSRAQMWMRVDRAGGQIGFFDNMFERPIKSSRWSEYRITGDIDADAQRINVGLMVFGPATAWIDSISFEVVGAAGGGNEAARPLAPRGLENLVAFARLLGYVRHFHPSDAAADTDWDTFAIRGIQVAEPAADAADLAEVLQQLFQPIAPEVRVTAGAFTGGIEPEPPNAKGYTFWEHAGFGQHFVADAPRQGPYASRRVRRPLPAAATENDNRPRPGSVIERELGGGVSCRVPMCSYYDRRGTLPRAERLDWSPPADWIASGNDRATRLGGVVLAWNVLEHFYPYFDVVDTDWAAVLDRTLAAAAEDPDAAAFGQTLSRMVAELHDGHGRVGGGAMRFGAYRLPFEVDWIGEELVVTVATRDAGVTPGDVVVSIDGSTPDELWDQLTPTISAATPQWLRHRVSRLITNRKTGDFFFAELRKPDGSRYSVRAKPVAMDTDLAERRPEKITEVRPGIWYVDIDRITDQDFNDALRELKRAKGIVFDLRGYPGKLSAVFIAHLIDEPVTSAQWHVPLVYRPDRERMTFRFSNWTIHPKEPRLTDRVAFVTDGRAISAAETYLGIIEHYQLAQIVGAATAGTNGNVNPIRLPGGYTISWTGMKVLKHDGSRHHGVGILPTIPVHRTIRGVAEGRDEVLERGIEAVSKP